MSPPRTLRVMFTRRFSIELDVGDHELGLDRVGIRNRIDSAIHMDHIAILETAQDMGDGIDFADVGEKLVAKALALGGALDQTGDVHEGHPGRDRLLGFRDFRQLFKA